MIVIKVDAIMLGLVFTLFGYFIYFRGKYNLINGFEIDYQRGFKDEQYAKRVGLIEFTVGVISLVIGLTLILFA